MAKVVNSTWVLTRLKIIFLIHLKLRLKSPPRPFDTLLSQLPEVINTTWWLAQGMSAFGKVKGRIVARPVDARLHADATGPTQGFCPQEVSHSSGRRSRGADVCCCGENRGHPEHPGTGADRCTLASRAASPRSRRCGRQQRTGCQGHRGVRAAWKRAVLFSPPVLGTMQGLSQGQPSTFLRALLCPGPSWQGQVGNPQWDPGASPLPSTTSNTLLFLCLPGELLSILQTSAGMSLLRETSPVPGL